MASTYHVPIAIFKPVLSCRNRHESRRRRRLPGRPQRELDGMPSSTSIPLQNGRHEEEVDGGPVAVVALANALLDMFITVKDDSLIKKYGLPSDGQVEVTTDQQEIFTEILQNYPVEYVAGGSAQNTVRLVSRLTKAVEQEDHRPGSLGPSYVLGKIATRDRIGTVLEHLLARDGVLTRYVRDDKLPTGSCAALVRPDGTRCLAANIGAARGFPASELDQIGAYGLIDRASVLYVEGFFASHSPGAALAALRHAHSRGGVVRILSLSAPYICRQFHEQIRQLLPYANLVVGNEEEFRTLAHGDHPTADLGRAIASSPYLPTGHKNSCQIADYLLGEDWDWMRLDERLAIVTCGARGAVCATRSHAWDFPLPTIPDRTVDTTGAGDAFLAGFLAQLLRKRPLSQCVAAGHRTAGLVISQIGCRLP